MTVYFEDFEIGHALVLGSVDITEYDILEFARRLDRAPSGVTPIPVGPGQSPPRL